MQEPQPATTSVVAGMQIIDNSRRAKNLIIAFGIMLGVTVISIYSDYLQLLLLEQINMGDFDDEAAATGDLRQGFVGLLEVTIYVVVIVHFIRWFRRAYENLGLLRSSLKFAENQALWCWFIPFVNLVRPRLIMGEIWNKTQQLADVPVIQGQGLLNLWWILWLVSNSVSNIAGRLIWRAETIDEMISATQMDFVAGIVGLFSATVAMYMVHVTAMFEKLLAEKVQSVQVYLMGR